VVEGQRQVAADKIWKDFTGTCCGRACTVDSYVRRCSDVTCTCVAQAGQGSSSRHILRLPFSNASQTIRPLHHIAGVTARYGFSWSTEVTEGATFDLIVYLRVLPEVV